MFTHVLTEPSVANGKSQSSANADEQEPETLTGERIEFQAPKGFTKKIDRAAKAMGLGRSAFLRMACMEFMRQKRS